MDRLAVFGVISSSSDSDVSSSCSDDEQEFNKTAVNKKSSTAKQTPEKSVKVSQDESSSQQDMPSFDPRISEDTSQASLLNSTFANTDLYDQV